MARSPPSSVKEWSRSRRGTCVLEGLDVVDRGEWTRNESEGEMKQEEGRGGEGEEGSSVVGRDRQTWADFFFILLCFGGWVDDYDDRRRDL